MNEQATTVESKARGGKYLTFCLGNEEYGLEILKVREIIGMQDLTAVPRTAPYVRGVMNLRGKVIPVVDLRMKLGMDAVETTRLTAIVVVQVRQTELGLIVDQVEEVLNVADEIVQDAPQLGMSIEDDLVLGLAKTQRGVTILLDADNVVQIDGLPTEAAAEQN